MSWLWQPSAAEASVATSSQTVVMSAVTVGTNTVLPNRGRSIAPVTVGTATRTITVTNLPGGSQTVNMTPVTVGTATVTPTVIRRQLVIMSPVTVGTATTSIVVGVFGGEPVDGAVSTWFWNQGHSKTQRTAEILRVKHVRPTGEAIERYDLPADQPGHHINGPIPNLVNQFTGESESPPMVYPMRHGTADNPTGEEAYVFTKNGHTQYIWFAHRFGLVNRWRTALAAPWNLDVEWMADNQETAMGLSQGGAEFLVEHPASASINIHGPTHGGARNQPFDVNAVPADALRTPMSVVTHVRVTDEYLEGCVTPLDFRDDPDLIPGLPYSPMGTDATTSALYWRYKQFERTTPLHNGDPFVSLQHRFFFVPEDHDQADFPGGSMSASTSTLGASLMQQLSPDFDQGFFADLQVDSVLRDIETMIVGPTFDLGSIQRWNADENGVQYVGVGFGAAASPFPSGFIALCFTRSSDGFTIGAAIRLGTVLQPLEGPAHPTNITLQNGDVSGVAQVVGIPFPNHAHPTAKILSIGSATTAPALRKAGWTGFHFLQFAGPKDEFMTSMRKAANVLGRLPDIRSILPPNVREGTELADTVEATAAPVERVKLPPNVTFSSRLR